MGARLNINQSNPTLLGQQTRLMQEFWQNQTLPNLQGITAAQHIVPDNAFAFVFVCAFVFAFVFVSVFVFDNFSSYLLKLLQHVPCQGQHWLNQPDPTGQTTKADHPPPQCTPLHSLTQWREGRRSSRPPVARHNVAALPHQ